MDERATPHFLVAYFGGRDAINGHALEALVGDVLEYQVDRYAVRAGTLQRLADFGSKLTAWAESLQQHQEQAVHGNQ